MADDLLRRLEWDSRFFGCEIARIDLSTGPDLDSSLRKALESRIALLYVFVPAERLGLLVDVVRRGGRLVDVRVDLECSSVDAASSEGARLAVAGDRAAVVDAAARLAEQSRFQCDDRISHERVDAMYRIWGERCLEEGVVALSVDGGQGLVGVRSTADAVDVELVWVDTAARGRGLARALVAAALEPLRPNLVRVATQAGNIPALRLYEALGFRTTKVTAILHLWLDEAHP